MREKQRQEERLVAGRSLRSRIFRVSPPSGSLESVGDLQIEAQSI